jgi:beta-aspartyl-peptidase (threonine type)
LHELPSSGKFEQRAINFIMKKYGIAVHGGAGVISRNQLTPEKENRYREELSHALQTGYAALEQGGSSLDAVTEAVRTLENHDSFNAGRGAVFNHVGRHEMDASIMDGTSLKAGAVCAIHNIKNPVLLAREIMLHSEHVMLCGQGAEEFARERNIEFAEDSYFFTKHRYDQWQRALEKEYMQLDDGSTKKFGTVGAVARDQHGNLAAATSTGGLTNKRFGRVGDSPIIGAGTYANNATCAVSCTGHGEFFIRSVVAFDIHALMAYKGLSLKDACQEVVMKKLVAIKAEGGLISIDCHGNIEMPFNSEGMYRASRRSGEDAIISIY